MIKIWRNRVWAGTQKLSNCPIRYKTGVIVMMRQDLQDKTSGYNIEILNELLNRESVSSLGALSDYLYDVVSALDVIGKPRKSGTHQHCYAYQE